MQNYPPWLKFQIEIYSEPIRFIPKSVSEPIRTHPSNSEKKFRSRLMQFGKKSIRLNSRLWIRMNPDNFSILMNPRLELFGLIRIENSV